METNIRKSYWRWLIPVLIIVFILAGIGLWWTLSKMMFSHDVTGILNGHEYVDLGLSVKWATCNIGAEAPYEYGGAYAWGETSEKKMYTEGNSLTWRKRFPDIGGNPAYDAAARLWESGWRLPSKSELEELTSECTWEQVRYKGQKGYKVTGPNGNSIFLPAAGYHGTYARHHEGSDGDYWSSTPSSSHTKFAFFLAFDHKGCFVFSTARDFGHSIRPVTK